MNICICICIYVYLCVNVHFQVYEMYIYAIYTYVEKGKQTKDIYFVLVMIYLLFIIFGFQNLPAYKTIRLKNCFKY